MLRLSLVFLFVTLSLTAKAQKFLTDVLDTTSSEGLANFSLLGDKDILKFGGYMQPQFQFIQSKGAKTFNGGDFQKNSDNRFMFRRGRIRMDYLHRNKDHKDVAYFVFQFDGTERGVNIRDFWGRIFINKYDLAHVTMGMFARPFGFELLYSSSDREAPERGRMSQILLKTERDLGVMLTINKRGKGNQWYRKMKWDLGVFNGQGMAGPAEYDSHKDIISRLSLRPTRIFSNKAEISAGAAILYGGIVSESEEHYTMNTMGTPQFIRDSSAANIGKVSPRHYYDADVQLKIPRSKGFSELRLEYMRGTQTANKYTSETPGTYPREGGVAQPFYVRPFHGAYITFIQSIADDKLQALLRYDFYDPNRRIAGKGISSAAGFNEADIMYQTFGFGAMYHFNPHLKMVAFYDMVKNEKTALTGYDQDLKDNVFTLRFQYRF